MLHFILLPFLLLEFIKCSVIPTGAYSGTYTTRSFVQHDSPNGYGASGIPSNTYTSTVFSPNGYPQYGLPIAPVNVIMSNRVPYVLSDQSAGYRSNLIPLQVPPKSLDASSFQRQQQLLPTSYQVNGLGSVTEQVSVPGSPIAATNSLETENYKFGYVVVDPYSGDIKSQQEENTDGVVKGFFSLLQPDGIIRNVYYTADDLNGFNAQVQNIPVPSYLPSQPASVKIDPCKELLQKLTLLGEAKLVKNVSTINDIDTTKVNVTILADNETSTTTTEIPSPTSTETTSKDFETTTTKGTENTPQGLTLTLNEVLQCVVAHAK